MINLIDFIAPDRVECYSCKMVNTDKKLYKTMTAEPGTSPHDLQALSLPPESLISCISPNFGSNFRYTQRRGSCFEWDRTESVNRLFGWFQCFQTKKILSGHTHISEIRHCTSYLLPLSVPISRLVCRDYRVWRIFLSRRCFSEQKVVILKLC